MNIHYLRLEEILPMISVAQAIQLIEKNAIPGEISVMVACEDALNQILAEDIMSEIDLPSFRQSEMDGYALRLHQSNRYLLQGEIPAGTSLNPEMKAGEAYRIFTGAPVPDEADCVVMQENIELADREILVNSKPEPQRFIRQIGQQIGKGDIALKAGTRLTPAALGYLSALGLTEVPVYSNPTIAIVVTGDELQEPGVPLRHGQIYESNSLMLKKALESSGFRKVQKFKVKDDMAATRDLLENLLDRFELLLISGGISVGEYDFVGKVLTQLGTEEIFYKVKQKPGKPLFFGKKGSSLVFALPGNPASSLSCFYLYVLPALRLITRHPVPHLERRKLQVTNDYQGDGSRAHFLKGKYANNQVTILNKQASSMIHSFAVADVLIHMPEGTQSIKKGEFVETIFLPV